MPEHGTNALRFMLTDQARALFGDEWALLVAEQIGIFRRREGDEPRDPAAARLVADLCEADAFFRTVWADRTVVAGSRPVKHFQHPVAGPLEMAVETLEVAGAPGQRLVVMTPTTGVLPQLVLAG